MQKQSGCLSILLIAIGAILIAFTWLSFGFGKMGYALKKGGVILPTHKINSSLLYTGIGLFCIILAKTLDYFAHKKNK